MKSETNEPERKLQKVTKGDLNTTSANDFGGGPQEFTVTNTDITKLSSRLAEFRSKYNDAPARKMLEGKNVYEITFKNIGGLVSPLVIEWTYKDGTKEQEIVPAEIWKINEVEITKVFVKEKEVINIILDPGFALGDVNMTNNVFPKKTSQSKFDQFKKTN
jgi:hypothetical protein